ncbi:MAG: hypothetical protein ACO25B_06425 [Chitinophagaceae bacterium]
MKKIYLAFLLAGMLLHTSNAGALSTTPATAPVLPEAVMKMKAVNFIKLNIRDFSKISGKKITLKERLTFSILKANLKKAVKKNPDMLVGDYLAGGAKKISTGAWIAIISGVILITIWILATVPYGPLS